MLEHGLGSESNPGPDSSTDSKPNSDAGFQDGEHYNCVGKRRDEYLHGRREPPSRDPVLMLGDPEEPIQR